jgi:succinoglycan biosynthesis transport protein ExoP
MNTGPLDIRDYIEILWARKWTIVAVTIVTTSVALYYASRQPEVYGASADVLVRAVVFGTGTSSTELGVENIDTEAEVANSRPVTDLAERQLEARGIEPAETAARPLGLADGLRFESVSEDPASAQASANAYARAYLELRQEQAVDELIASRAPLEKRLKLLDDQLERIARQIRDARTDQEEFTLTNQYGLVVGERAAVTQKLGDLATPSSLRVGEILRSADLPSAPTGSGALRTGAVGFVVGLALGIALALFRDRMDDRVRGRNELEIHSGAPVLAFIPRIPLKKGAAEPITVREPTSEAAEAYKTLQLRLFHPSRGLPVRSFVVTSSLPGEGTTTTAANLAVSLARAGKSVVVIGADLRKPTLQTLFRGANGVGLTEVLTGKRMPVDALSSSGTKNLWVMHTGPRLEGQSPLELLAADRMTELIRDLEEAADILIFDTPPLLTSSDVVAIAPYTDGVLFVTDPRVADGPIVEQARHELGTLSVPVIGVVVNRYDPRRFRAYGTGYGYGYGAEGREAASRSPSRPGLPGVDETRA